MEHAILVTLGPSSLKEDFVKLCCRENVSLLRINLSHTSLKDVEPTIKKIQQWTDVPICLDSEGAQIRNGKMQAGHVAFQKEDFVRIHFNGVIGDSNNISFTPAGIAEQFEEGDGITVDFNSTCLRVVEKFSEYCLAIVEQGGMVGSNKATDLDRKVSLEPITKKDKEAIKIGRKLGIKHFALSFANCREDVEHMRKLVGTDSCLISKIESADGILNLQEILSATDQILIDRGDLSRQVPIEKIPLLQRRIISLARSKGIPVFVATNLLESMVITSIPTRAEVNDVVSTLLMGANGLVLAGETAIGKFPIESVIMVRKLLNQVQRWTPNTTLEEIMYD